jgi:hypothetical protein
MFVSSKTEKNDMFLLMETNKIVNINKMKLYVFFEISFASLFEQLCFKDTNRSLKKNSVLLKHEVQGIKICFLRFRSKKRFF